MIDITVVVVNYNTAKEIVACLDSLLRQREVNVEVIVVDNASIDNSLDVLAQYKDKIQVIASKENLGFGRANNLGFEKLNSSFVFLLNPDARLPDDLALKQLLDYAKQHNDIGLIAPKMLDESEQHETLPCYTYPGQTHTKQKFTTLPGNIAWVIGACMLIPWHVYQEIGGFDESFFLYGEDADICLRIRQAGYAIEQLTDVLVIHIGGASEKTSVFYDKTMRKQKALHHFYQQHYSHQDVIYLVLREMKRARWRMLFRRKNNPRYEHYRAVYDSSKQFLEARS